MQARIGFADLVDRIDGLTEAQDQSLFGFRDRVDTLQADEDGNRKNDNAEACGSLIASLRTVAVLAEFVERQVGHGPGLVIEHDQGPTGGRFPRSSPDTCGAV